MFLFLLSRTRVFSFFFRLRPLFPPPPLKVPPLPVSVEHCLSFDCFRFPSCEFRSIFCFPFFNFISLSPTSLFLSSMFTVFVFSFISINLSRSVCSRVGPFRRRALRGGGNLPVFAPPWKIKKTHSVSFARAVCVVYKKERERAERPWKVF